MPISSVGPRLSRRPGPPPRWRKNRKWKASGGHSGSAKSPSPTTAETVAVFGLPPTMERVPFDWDTFFRKRLDIHTVFGAQDEPGLPAFQLSVDFITRGEVDMAPFVTHQLPIAQVQEAFDLASSKEDGALKVSLTF